jgi:hypothetical protein
MRAGRVGLSRPVETVSKKLNYSDWMGEYAVFRARDANYPYGLILSHSSEDRTSPVQATHF